MATKQRKPTIAEATRKAEEAMAQGHARLGMAFDCLHHASTDKMRASAVIIHITALGGREVVKPFSISDGLSLETVEAIKRDIVRSYKLHKVYQSKEFRETIEKD